jgi:membrane protein DedA with SNARE-associated domain
MSTELMPPAAEGALEEPAPPIDEAVSTEELSTPVKRLILGGLLVTTAIGVLGTAFLPYLMVKHPLLLLLTSADARNLVLVASQLDLPVVLAIALPRRVVAMMVTYGVGRLYGRAMLDWSSKRMPRLGKVAAAFERLFLRFRPLVLLAVPTYSSAAIAGVTRTCWQAFVPWMLIGQVLYIGAVFYIGDAAGGVTQWIGDAFAKYLWQTTAVFVLVVGTQQLIAYVRRRRSAERAGGTPAAP